MTKRKFFKTKIEVEVLSEEPFEYDSINDIAYSITQGDCSGVLIHKGMKKLNGKQIANELLKQGSDLEFFQLDKQGNDL